MSLYITLFDGEIVSEDDRAFRCSAACRDLMSGPRRPGKLHFLHESGSGTFRTWPDWLTMSVHGAKAEVSFERPEVC
jgi:hypothetical protein